jgi:peroxiredoxin
MALYTPAVELGIKPKNFRLLGVDEKYHELAEYTREAQALVIMFICNHCPYVKAIEDRLIQLALDCAKIKVPVVAICSNDPQDYPEDSFEQMKARAQAKNYPFPYLQDLTQSVAKEYGAVCTPDFFVYDKNLSLSYRGRLDDSWKEPALVKTRELFQAVQDLVAGHQDSLSLKKQTPSMGCSIKWKKS